jgi:hypothetical protein
VAGTRQRRTKQWRKLEWKIQRGGGKVANEVVTHKHTNQPRVHVSFTKTYNLGNYSNIKTEVGLSDDCSNGETPEEGIQRVSELVQGQFEELCAKIEGKQKGGKR